MRSARIRSRAVTAALVAVTGGALLTAPALAVSGDAATTYNFTAKITADGRACSGALVAPAWVLTVPSCFPENPNGGAPAKATTVVVGRVNLGSTAGITAHASKLVPDAGHTVMLVKLDKAATGITPVPLSTTAPTAGDPVRLAGFGRTADEWIPNVLHTSAFTVGTVDATQLVLHSDTADACKGDAGAPAFREAGGLATLVGVTTSSLQHGCMGIEQPQQGTTEIRTDTLAAWIGQQTAPAQVQCTPATVWSERAGGGMWHYVHNDAANGTANWVNPTAAVGSGWLGRMLAAPGGIVWDIHKNTGAADTFADGVIRRFAWNGTKWTGGGQVGGGWAPYLTAAYANRVTVDSQGRIFAINAKGELRVFIWDTATNNWVNGAGVSLGTNWLMYNSITAAGDGVLYARTPAGALFRYEYSFADNRWLQIAEPIGTGWQMFSEIFSPGADILYARGSSISTGPVLRWYKRDDNTDTWAPLAADGAGKVVGYGWTTELHVSADPSACKLVK